MKKKISIVITLILIIGIVIGTRSYALKYVVSKQQQWNIEMKYKNEPIASGKIKFLKNDRVDLINSDGTINKFKYKTEFNRLVIISKEYGNQIFIVKSIDQSNLSGRYKSTVTNENGQFTLTR